MEAESKVKSKTRPKKVKQTVLSTVNPTPSASSFNNDISNNQIPCRFFQIGQCNKGDDCPFLHRKAAHFSPHPCKFFMSGTGFCRHGDQCPFMHYKEEIRQDQDDFNNELTDDNHLQQKYDSNIIHEPLSTLHHKINNDTPLNITQRTSLQNNTSLNFWTEKRIHRERNDENLININDEKQKNFNELSLSSSRSKFMMKNVEQAHGEDIFSDIQSHVINYLFDDDQTISPGRKLPVFNYDNRSQINNHDIENFKVPLTKQLKELNIGLNKYDNKDIKNEMNQNITTAIYKPNKLFSEALLSNKNNDPLFDFLNEDVYLKNEQKFTQIRNLSKETSLRDQNIQSQPKSFLEVAQANINKPPTKTKVNIISKNDNIPKSNTENSSNQEVSPTLENKKRLLCTFYYEGSCRYKDSCKFVHGNMCNICNKNALYPNDFEQNKKHVKNCSLKLELENSKTIECTLCKENVIKKGQKFGLLPECDDIFCVTCIKQYRTESSNAECPICTTVSHFVVPSRVFPTSSERKKEIIELYKIKMKKILCKYYESGECKFGDYCHYSHDISLNENMKESYNTENDLIKRNNNL